MIKQTIDQDIKTAMLSGDKRMANALRNLKSAILSAEIATGQREEGLGDTETISLLQKELKKRSEAAALYEQGGNAESAAEEHYEETVIQKYLPKQLSEAEINELIDRALAEYDGEPDGRAMGVLIGAVKAKSGGAADGALIARLVKARHAGKITWDYARLSRHLDRRAAAQLWFRRTTCPDANRCSLD
jgi:uncharacterized protein